MNLKSQWMYSKRIDLLFMLLGIGCFFILKFDTNVSLFTGILIWISVFIFDSGHVYLSYGRTFKEYTHLRKLVISSHIFFFLFFYSYQYFKLNYLWHFVVYMTLFHFLRQFYGVYRQYLLKNKSVRKADSRVLDFFFYSLTILPIIAFHFRADIGSIGYYAKTDTFTYPHEELFENFYYLNIGFFILWLIYEAYLLRMGRVLISQFFSCLSTFVLFFIVFTYSRNEAQVIIPIVLTHGSQYYLFTADHLKKRHQFSNISIILSLAFLGVFIGTLSGYWEEELNLDYAYLSESSQLNMISVSLLLMFLFYHYFIDSIFWRRKYLDKYLTVSSVSGNSETSKRSK